MIEPNEVLVAGDWHGDVLWGRRVARALPDLLPDQPRLVIQLGDFGIWPGRTGKKYLSDLTYWLRRADAHLWFLHGNHEDHDRLDALYEGPEPVALTSRITWLPVNTRWTWHGRRWVAVGGAASVDRALRYPGTSWWAGEAITASEAQEVMASGPAEVMLSHEAPASVPLVMGRPSPGWAVEDLARSQAQRELLQQVMEKVQPELVMHGHHHQWQCSLASAAGRPVQAVSLDMNLTTGNLVRLDTRSLEFWPIALPSK